MLGASTDSISTLSAVWFSQFDRQLSVSFHCMSGEGRLAWDGQGRYGRVQWSKQGSSVCRRVELDEVVRGRPGLREEGLVLWTGYDLQGKPEMSNPPFFSGSFKTDLQ